MPARDLANSSTRNDASGLAEVSVQADRHGDRAVRRSSIAQADFRNVPRRGRGRRHLPVQGEPAVERIYVARATSLALPLRRGSGEGSAARAAALPPTPHHPAWRASPTSSRGEEPRLRPSPRGANAARLTRRPRNRSTSCARLGPARSSPPGDKRPRSRVAKAFLRASEQVVCDHLRPAVGLVDRREKWRCRPRPGNGPSPARGRSSTGRALARRDARSSGHGSGGRSEMFE